MGWNSKWMYPTCPRVRACSFWTVSTTLSSDSACHSDYLSREIEDDFKNFGICSTSTVISAAVF